MMESLLGPCSSIGLLILRVGLALVIIAHGWPKINPNSPMKGVAGMTGFLKQINVPAPTFLAWVVALLETVGSVLLILGIGTRILGLLFAIGMLVAIVKARIGLEFEFLLLTGSLALVFTNPGSIALLPSLDL